MKPSWLAPVNSSIQHELDHSKPILYVLPIENILGRLLVVQWVTPGVRDDSAWNAKCFEQVHADSSPGAGPLQTAAMAFLNLKQYQDASAFLYELNVASWISTLTSGLEYAICKLLGLKIRNNR